MQSFWRKNEKSAPLRRVEFSWLSNGGTRLVLTLKNREKTDFEVKKCKNKKLFERIIPVVLRTGIHVDPHDNIENITV